MRIIVGAVRFVRQPPGGARRKVAVRWNRVRFCLAAAACFPAWRLPLVAAPWVLLRNRGPFAKVFISLHFRLGAGFRVGPLGGLPLPVRFPSRPFEPRFSGGPPSPFFPVAPGRLGRAQTHALKGAPSGRWEGIPSFQGEAGNLIRRAGGVVIRVRMNGAVLDGRRPSGGTLNGTQDRIAAA